MESHASSPLVGGLQAQAGGGRRLQISNYFFAIFTFGKKKGKIVNFKSTHCLFEERIIKSQIVC